MPYFVDFFDKSTNLEPQMNIQAGILLKLNNLASMMNTTSYYLCHCYGKSTN